MSSSFFGSRRQVSKKRAQRSSQRRRVLFEQLEDRRLLAADWHNPVTATDVNADQHVTPLDALRVINKLDSDGSGQLPALTRGARPNAYYDTTGDGFLSPLDALLVINAIEAAQLTGSGSSATAQPMVSIVPVDATTILATYDRAMSANAIDPANYAITGDDGQPIDVIGAVFAEGESSVVQLQTAPISSGGYTVSINNVTDGAGQNVFFEGRKLLTGNPKGAVVSVAATSSTRVVVVFNEAMADNALAPQNYLIQDPSGKSLPVTDVRFNGPLGMVFVLSTAAQSNVNYRLTVTGVTDLQNDGLQSNTGNFQGIAGLPKLIAATPAGPNSVLLTFNRTMSDDALSPSAYVIKNSAGATLSVLSAQFIGVERRLVQLVTGPQSPGTYTIESITATDVDGNPMTPPGTAGSFQGAPAPSLIAATPTDTTHLFLTFGSPLSDSALSPSSYKLEKLDAQGNVANTLPVSEVAFVGSQRTVVSLTTPYQSDAQYRISTTGGLFDATGSPLANVALEFQGLGSQPRVIGVTSTGPTALLITFSVPMSDDALAPASYVIQDSAGVPLPVTNVQFVGTDRRLVQVTTGPQAAGNYTIVSITATDLGGSQLAPLGPAGEFAGAPAPILDKVSPVDPTHLVLAFTGPVSDSALAPSSYLLEKLDAQGNVVGSVAVSAAAFLGSENTVVSLTTPYLADGRYRISTTGSLTDTTGSPLDVIQIEFQGIGAPPKLLGASSAGPSTVLLITTAAMSDDVLAPSSYTIKNSAGVTLEVLGAQFVGTERRVIELTTAPQAARAYTILSLAANDLSGNPLAPPGGAGVFQGAAETTLVRSLPTDPTHIVLTFGGPVGDSALAPSSYTIDKLDAQGNVVGSLSVTTAVFIGEQRTVVSLTTPYQADSRYRLSTTSSLADATGAPLAPVQQEFQGFSSLAKLVAVTSNGPTTVQAIFNVPMSDDALSTAAYVIKDSAGVALQLLNVNFVGTERRVVELTTAPQAAGTYTIQSITATDINGSPVIAVGSIGGFAGSLATTMRHATPADATHIILTFGGPVGDSALAPSSYIIDKLDAQGNVIGSLSVTSAAFIGDQHRVVSLTTPFQTSGQYRISTTSALRDVSGASLPVVQLQFQGLGIPAKLVGATSTAQTTMLLTFNVSMSDDVLSPSSYVINNSAGVRLPVVSAQFVGTERRVVKLTTGPQSADTYTFQSIAATDVSGNSVSSTIAIGGVQGIAAPSLNIATATDSTHIYLTFAGPVGDSALSPSSYRIDQLDVQGNVIGNLAVSSAAFVGNQRTVVALTTPSQSTGPYRLITTSTLTDVAGSPVPTVQIDFQGVGSQAQLVAVSSTSSTTMIVTFNVPMSDDALSPSLYDIRDASGNRLQIVNAQFIGTEHRLVQLTTGPQTSASYTVVSINSTDVGGSTTIIPTSTTINTFPGPITSGGVSVPVDGPPRVVGAVSLSNTSVLVAFSEPMGDAALNASNYFIVQDSVNPEVGYVPVLSAAFNPNDHSAVILTTGSQNELTYSVTAVNVTDQAGNALAPAVLAGGQRIDPTSASFPGTPPGGTQIVDTDDDGLSDNVEVRGWTVTVTLLNGNTVTREVTSDPTNPDTDGDGLWDAQELNIGIDPRAKDTDGDQLDDWAEFNEIYSDPTNQDSDGDSFDDFLEFAFFKTSPYLADTDGDQLTDDYEILGNRNPRVADLPRPEISVGEVSLRLDVRFTETNDQERRDLQTKQVTSSLSRGTSQSYSRSDTVNLEAHMEFGVELDTATGNLTISETAGGSVGYTFEQTSESAIETQQAYETSLSTDKEVTRGFSVERTVEGAQMSVAIDLRNLSSLAYRVKNLQVTAFIQDPQDHSKLTPVATLLPDNEPDEGFTLGPLVTQKGPFIFSADDSIIPSLVESLMANSSGLVFRISNYDIVDEAERNFAFTSQEVVERTARMVIDYGGASSLRALLTGEAFDELQPGDETEIYRVATSAGRPVADTNNDGDINEDDTRIIFDVDLGKEVGITLFEALSAVGLTQYEEATTPTNSLSDEEILSSYSTFKDTTGREKIFRIRGISNDDINQKYWEILTPLGIDQVTDLKNLILKTDSPVSLNFVQDLDRDGLTADVEFFLRTSDSPNPRGAEVPGTTDFVTDESVTYTTDPNFVTGAIVRVTDTLTGGGLMAETNYYIRNLGLGSYSFYDTKLHATTISSTVGRVDLTGKITAGIFTAPTPVSTDFGLTESVSFAADPAFPTGTVVQVTDPGGGLTVGENYFVRRNLFDGTYSFFDSAVNATANSDVTTGRVDLTGNITAGIFSPTAKGRDTDGDGLDDRFEALIGWTVSTPQRTYRVYSSPNRADSNFDAPKPGVNSDDDYYDVQKTKPKYDLDEYEGSDLFAAPGGWEDKLTVDTNGDQVPDVGNGLRDRFEVFQLPALNGIPDYVLDPSRKDTDSDGIRDATEIIGFKITPITGESAFWVTTNPNSPDTDGDTFSDGFERIIGLNPTSDTDTDDDGDGLPDPVEDLGWSVYVFGVSTTPYKQGDYAPGYGGSVTPASTDPSTDVVKFNAGNVPNIQRYSLVKVTGGGLTPNTPYFLGKLVEQPDPDSVQFSLYQSARDAAGGTARGALDLTGSVTSIQIANENRKMSRTDAVDSDGDGLTDYEEFFLGTDPSSVDSDRDGIEDRVEQLGYALGHQVGGNDLGIITTDPLDADTDNDKRSDGAEAELIDIELARWVVRTEGKTPYRVYSDPLFADNDFDGVVDGDEFSGTYRTDPNNGNTDGDLFDDGQEFNGGSNPLKLEVDLFRVTVFITSLTIDGDGDWDQGDNNGDFAFDFGVRKPGTGPAGLSPNFTSIVHDSIRLDDPFQYHLALNARQVEPQLPAGNGPLQNNPTSPGIAFNGPPSTTLNFGRTLPVTSRSVTFSMSASDSFSIEGIVGELDYQGENGRYNNNSTNPNDYTVQWVYLGGLDGKGARKKGETDDTGKIRPVFRGSDLQLEDKPFLDYEIYFRRQDVEGHDNGDRFNGYLSFTIFIG